MYRWGLLASEGLLASGVAIQVLGVGFSGGATKSDSTPRINRKSYITYDW